MDEGAELYGVVTMSTRQILMFVLHTLARLTTRPTAGGIVTGNPQMRGSLRQLYHVCVSCIRKALEPFEPYSYSATVQLQI